MTAMLVRVCDVSQVGAARRCAVQVARRLGFGEADVGKVALVATEAGSNLVKHADGGELLIQPLVQQSPAGIALVALDRGRGIADLQAALRDGVSTAGSPGTGLGAVARLADRFDVHSAPTGTGLLACLWPRAARPAPAAAVHSAAVSVPLPGEEVCGDGWAVHQDGSRLVALVVDGLGHGAGAADAAGAAVDAFRLDGGLAPATLMARLHEALRSTRGAAAAVADVDCGAARVRFCGIGNVAAVITGEQVQRAVSHHGTLGHAVRRIQEFEYAWTPRSVLVMHTDGVGTHWKSGDYPGFAACDPQLAAALLFRDHRRGRDDATVLVAREAA